MDIHANPEAFLRILIGLSKASLSQLGFDVSLLDETGNRRVLIKKEGKKDQEVIIDKLLFISDILHGRGTTVWGGTMGFDSSDVLEGSARSRLGKEVRVAVKDSWLDPIRKYTEGFILKTLNDSRVTGVPTFIHEQQVQAPHPTHPDTIFNSSTHLLRAFLSQANRCANRRQYQLRFLSRLVTTPFGVEVLEFNSLAELLVIFIDYVSTHKDAIEKAGIIHRDVSLFNLLAVLWNAESGADERLEFLDALPAEDRELLRQKIKKALSQRGLFADWGYAVPITPPSSDPITAPSTPDSADPIDHKFWECGEETVPALHHDRSNQHQPPSLKYVAVSKLQSDHEIKVQMAGELLDPDRPSIDTNPLSRTGTWSWMAAELVLAGPGKPVVHRAAHDLESLFYVLVGICVLLKHPHKVKNEDELTCFDAFFNSFQPSTAKTSVIQSEVGWVSDILPHITPYFQPLIPLLSKLRQKIIVPMRILDGQLHPSKDEVTHDFMLEALLEALYGLKDESWVKILPKSAGSVPPQSPAVASSSNKSGSVDPAPCALRATEYLYSSRIPRPTTPLRAMSGSGFPPANLKAASSSPNRRRSPNTEIDSQRAKRQRKMSPAASSSTLPPLRTWFSSTGPSAYHTQK